MHTNGFTPEPLRPDPAHHVALPRAEGDQVIPWLGVIRPAGDSFNAYALGDGWVSGPRRTRADALAALEEAAGWLPAQDKNTVIRYKPNPDDPDETAPATPFDEIVIEHAANVHDQGTTDPDVAARAWGLRRDARYLLIEAHDDGAYWLSSHDTHADAAKSADASDYGWRPETLHDLATGRRYEGTRSTTFHRTDQRHPDAGAPFQHPDTPDAPTNGQLTGYCGHAITGTEWRTGYRTCEQCNPADYATPLHSEG